MHILAGWKGQVLPFLRLGVEAYYKDLEHLAFAEYSDVAQDGIRVDPIQGEAQGADFKLEVIRPAFYGAISYGLASVSYERQVEQVSVREVDDAADVILTTETQTITEHFSPPHDRRHQVNALLRVARGPFTLGIRWQFGSGLPYTQALGFYDDVPVGLPGDTDFRTDPGQPVLVTNRTLYAGRLPSYHRLDVALERRFTMGRVQATLQAAVINVYDRANIFDFDLFAGRRVNQLPLIPSLGLNVEVR